MCYRGWNEWTRRLGMITDRKRTIRLLLTTIMISVLVGCGIMLDTVSVLAASTETADIRFVFTTDLHGRLTTKDYELDQNYDTGSLAKAYTLVQQARSEMRKNNSFTFDLGDVLYDYTTENIYGMDPSAIQPIYQAMATMGYDAITLGNHEFDYGYDYIMKQMKGSGLEDICVVSNVTDARKGKSFFKNNMIITRQVTSKSGKKVGIKIGVIGETVPVLSIKRENYIGVLNTEDIVENTKKQAKELKKKGADIIVVLAHSGFGSENPTTLSKNAAYALTKISEVDVVLSGHEHRMFPSSEKSSEHYYSLSGVDKKTGLVNGKNLVMASDKGQSIGVVDLTVKITDSSVLITERESDIRTVKKSTKANLDIGKFFGEWEEVFSKAAKNVAGQLKPKQSLNNYLGLVEDTNTIQLFNDAKINYALEYVNSQNKKYKNYPIIAASNHNSYGQLSADDYADITGQITEANLSAIAPFNKYLFLYEITGSQLKEWLEWSASAYETTMASAHWTDETMSTLMEAHGVKSLIREEWLDEWSSFYIFDGISYTINPSSEPRYNYYGKKINETNRIYALNYNGTPITDDMKFVLATESITGTKSDVLKPISNNAIRKGINITLNVLLDYVKKLDEVGDIVPYADENWKITLPIKHEFLLKLSANANFDKEDLDYSLEKVYQSDNHIYYKATAQIKGIDLDGPSIVLASTNQHTTNQDIDIAVSAHDISGIEYLGYLPGDHSVNSIQGISGYEIQDGIFTVSQNGIYTVFGRDSLGNTSVAKIKVNNINRSVIQIPLITSYTNRMSTIKGVALPGSTVYFSTKAGEYTVKVNGDGTFTYALPSQKAGETVSVRAVDDSGRSSDIVDITVKRTGPNRPEVENVTNTHTVITGNTKDTVATIVAEVGRVVYVSENGGADIYKSSEKYDPNKKVVETSVRIHNNGVYSIEIPPKNSKVLVTVYGIDYAGRTSKVNSSRIEHVAPNPPIIYDVTDGENQVYGRVPLEEVGDIYNLLITIDGAVYETTTDSLGYFTMKTPNLDIGQKIGVVATDLVDEKVRKSASIQYRVKDVWNFMPESGNAYIILDEITNKSLAITGNSYRGNMNVVVKVGSDIQEIVTDSNGDFAILLEEPLEIGTQISAVIRGNDGGISESAVRKVLLGTPDEPMILNKNIYNTTKNITIVSNEIVTAHLIVKNKRYETKEYIYDEELGGYRYQLVIENVNSGNSIQVYTSNAAGSSSKVEMKVIQRAPNTPKIDSIDTNTELIKGTVHLIIEQVDGVNVVPTVENTGTKVYIQIGKKRYQGDIKDNGTFEIKVPKQKHKTTVSIWAENSMGKGPIGKVKVKLGKKTE